MRLRNKTKEVGATGHLTLATRDSDSDFAADLSIMRLHIKIRSIDRQEILKSEPGLPREPITTFSCAA
jgi:hypothetical protein